MDSILMMLSDRFFLNFIKGDRYQYLLGGLTISLQLTLMAAVLGLVIGLLLAIAKISFKRGPVKAFADAYIAIIRGTPSVVQLTIIYFVVFASVDVPKILVATCAFGINSGAYVAEIIRAGIQAVDKGQMEASRSLGMSYFKSMRFIVVPQAIKNILPALGNEFIVLLKETSIAGYIALDDLTRGGTIIRSQTYDAMTPLLAVAVIYFLLTSLLSAGLNKLEGRMRRGD